MIEERYCSFGISKLLREKGFDEPCRSYFINDLGDYRRCTVEITNRDCSSEQILRPTHQMAIDWLRKKHGILISIIPQEVAVGVNALCYGIYKITENSYHPIHNGHLANFMNDYKDVVDAALNYCLTELI